MVQNLFFVLVVVGLFWLAKKMFPVEHKPKLGRPATGAAANGARPAHINPYQSVSIDARSGCCSAASALQGKPFLVDEAPILPLGDCSSRRCDCRYVHLKDRRMTEDDRRSLFGISSNYQTISGGDDRRVKEKGRRQEDYTVSLDGLLS